MLVPDLASDSRLHRRSVLAEGRSVLMAMPQRDDRSTPPVAASTGSPVGVTPVRSADMASAAASGRRTAADSPRGRGDALVHTALELPRLTVTRIASALGVPRATLEAYRLGTRRMPVAVRARLAEYLARHAEGLRQLAAELGAEPGPASDD